MITQYADTDILFKTIASFSFLICYVSSFITLKNIVVSTYKFFFFRYNDRLIILYDDSNDAWKETICNTVELE